MSSAICVLGPGHEAELLRFLERSPQTTLFLRSNLRAAGLEYSGERHQGVYVAAFENDAIVAVAAHYWNDNVIVQASNHAEAIATAVVKASDRPVAGILGPNDQVVRVRQALGLENAETTVDSCEILFHLALRELRIPPALASGAVTCRASQGKDFDLLTDWAASYSIETLGAKPGRELTEASRARIEALHRERRQWVLEAKGKAVSYSAFNASLPDCVQVGGVWTPPKLRSRGYGRAVVAGSLSHAKREGVVDSVLFTAEDNHAAQAAYRALGYRPVGKYGMALFSC